MRTRAAVEAAFADAPTFEVAGRRLGGVTKQRAAQIAEEFCIPSPILQRWRRRGPVLIRKGVIVCAVPIEPWQHRLSDFYVRELAPEDIPFGIAVEASEKGEIVKVKLS